MSTEQSMLELADDFKKRIELKNKEIRLLKNKLLDARKDVIFAYSIVKYLDIQITDENIIDLVPEEISDKIGEIRSELSDKLQSVLLADVGDLEDE